MWLLYMKYQIKIRKCYRLNQQDEPINNQLRDFTYRTSEPNINLNDYAKPQVVIVSPFVKAKLNGNRLECGKCGAWLYSRGKKHIDLTGLSDEVKSQLKQIPIEVLIGIVKQPIEIKCKHKSQGKYCDAINEVLL